jgi:hypothetical protein
MARPLRSAGDSASAVVPLAAAAEAARAARLSFDNGLERYELRPGGQPDVLLQARFGEPLPVIWAAQHDVHIDYPLGARLGRRAEPSVILLNPSLSWSIDVHGSATHLDADFTALRLQVLALHSGIAHSRLALGPPTAEHAIRLCSATDLRVERPAGVPVRIELAKGVTDMTLDHRHYGGTGSGLTDQTPGYDLARTRYLIIATGGVNRLTVTTRQARENGPMTAYKDGMQCDSR